MYYSHPIGMTLLQTKWYDSTNNNINVNHRQKHNKS